MGTNGGLTYHIHGSDFSSDHAPSPEYLNQQLSKRKEMEHHQQSVDACREAVHYLCQGVSYFALVMVICSLGFVTSLEFFAYPVLLRKLTCKKDWTLLYETFIPASTLLANMIGSVLGGVLIDKVGRRPLFILSAATAIVAELVGFISLDTALFLTTRCISSLTMGILYITSLLYTIETCPTQHRLHVYLLHSFAQNSATTLIPLIVQNSPMDTVTGGIWEAIPTVSVIVLALGLLMGILFPEPSQSAKIRLNSTANLQSKFSVMQLENDDIIEPESSYGNYSDMFYKGGKVTAILLILLFLIGGLITTSVYLTFPIIQDVGGACPATDHFPRPCVPPSVTTLSDMLTVFGVSIAGSFLGYISVQRYGRKNSFRGPAALRVIAIISMVLCAKQSFMLSQTGFIVLFTSIMNFTVYLYCAELYAIRSRGTALGLLNGFRLMGIAVAFCLNPTILDSFSPNLRFSAYTVIGTLMFGCSLGLRKDTFTMALNIGDATVDIGI